MYLKMVNKWFNHIQGEDYFTTKLQLWQSLQTYEKISMTMQKRSNHIFTFKSICSRNI